MKLFAFGQGSPVAVGRDSANNYRRGLFWAGAIGLAVLAVDYPVVGSGFLNYDDPINITENPLITNFSLESLSDFWSGHFNGLYIPLVYTFWGLLAKVAQLMPASSGTLNPLPFHLANLGLHMASALLVFRLLRRLGGLPQAAAAGSLVFALHPLQVEAVAWVTGLKDLLSGFLALLVIHCYIRHLQTGQKGSGNIGAWWNYILAVGFFLLALLAKPSVVTVPLLAGVLGYFCMGQPLRRLARELLPMLALALFLAVVTLVAQQSGQSPPLISLWQRTLVAADALNFYAGKLLWPASLGPDYGRIPLSVLTNPRVYLTLLTPVLLGVAVYLSRRKRWLPAGLLIFILALLPVLGFQPFAHQVISTVADRYMYLAMLGPALLVARGWELLPARKVRLMALVILAGLAVKSTVQVRIWHDSLTFNRQAIQVNPLSVNAYNNLGSALDHAGNFKEAQEVYLQAIANVPQNPDAYHNLGSLYAKAYLHQAAILNFERALRLGSNRRTDTHMHLGDAYRAAGNRAAARHNYQLALNNAPREQYGSDEIAFIKANRDSL